MKSCLRLLQKALGKEKFQELENRVKTALKTNKTKNLADYAYDLAVQNDIDHFKMVECVQEMIKTFQD